MIGEQSVKAVITGPVPAQGETVHLQFKPDQTRLYRNGWIASERAAS